MSLFVTTFCILLTHKVLAYTSELPMVKEQGSVNLIPFPASAAYMNLVGSRRELAWRWPCFVISVVKNSRKQNN